MLAPYRWIKDYADINDSAEVLAEKMVMTGNGVENIEKLGDNMNNVVVGQIVKLEKHPDADRLQICTIDAGKDEPVQIVTGADNVFEGAKVPAALAGAVLPNGQCIKKGKLRGVESYGMLCSGEELCISEDEFPGSGVNGIYILPEDAPVGTEMKDYLGLSGSVIEFEIGANRPDCLSIIGIAKEAAAATGVSYHDPDISYKTSGGNVNSCIKVSVDAPELCTRYMAASVKNIKIGSSPDWMKKRLREAGIRPINNIVDITNFVMIETGQPMHAFDASDIGGSQIIVRRAAAGEKLVTLDEKERELTDSMLVICDGSKPIGLAGIMGGENSEIKESTTDIVFESACFMYGNIRQTSRALGLATESSMRFSKGVTPQLAEFALKRALNLVYTLGCGEIENGLIDICSADLSEKTVDAPVVYINRLLGTVLSGEEMCRYLNLVSIKTEIKDHVLHCVIPAFRTDLFGKADIAEEVARMYGYDNITVSELPGTSGVSLPASEQVREKIRTYLGQAGFYECVTYSFAGPADYEKIGLPVPESIVIRNPLGDDTSLMRTTLVPDMLTVVSNNLAKKNMQLRLYETGKHYFPNAECSIDAPVIEHPVLMMAVCGSSEDFFTLKGEAENVIRTITGKEMKCRMAEVPYLHPGKCAEILLGDVSVGIMGEVLAETAENFGISSKMPRVYIAEIRIDMLMELTEKVNIRYRALPKFPASERDIAVIVDESAGAGDVLESIIRAGGKKLEKAELFDVYRSEQLGKGLKSLAYKLVFRAEDRTLTDADTEAAFEKILRTLETDFGAKLR